MAQCFFLLFSLRHIRFVHTFSTSTVPMNNKFSFGSHSFLFSCKTDNFRCVYAGAIKMNKQLTLNVSRAINCFHFFVRVKFSNNWKMRPKCLRKMRNLTMNVSELGKNVNTTTTYRENNRINLRNDKRSWILSRLQVKICVTFFSLA